MENWEISEDATVTLDKDEPKMRYSDICNYCKNLTDGEARTCRAFPKGIPEAIWVGDNDHTSSYEGDHDILFEPFEEEE